MAMDRTMKISVKFISFSQLNSVYNLNSITIDHYKIPKINSLLNKEKQTY